LPLRAKQQLAVSTMMKQELSRQRKQELSRQRMLRVMLLMLSLGLLRLLIILQADTEMLIGLNGTGRLID
jgi:hypothetical protein